LADRERRGLDGEAAGRRGAEVARDLADDAVAALRDVTGVDADAERPGGDHAGERLAIDPRDRPVLDQHHLLDAGDRRDRRRDAGWSSEGMMYVAVRTGTGGGGNPRAVDIAVRVAAASRNQRA